MTADDFEAAGLYDPRAPDAAERLELLEWLAERGATLEQMRQAERERGLTGLAGDLVLQQGHRYTLDEAAERTGMSADRLRELTLSVGLPVSREDRLLTEESVEMFRFYSATA